MNKQQVSKNIEIAKKYLETYHLLLPDDENIFDCYCLPPYRWKAFYAQIYKTDGIYRVNCAYTRYSDHFGEVSFSQPFTSVMTDTHPSRKTDAFCKCFFPDADIIDDLIKCAENYDANENPIEERTVIDGVTAGVRIFENGFVAKDICLVSSDASDLLLEKILRFSDLI